MKAPLFYKAFNIRTNEHEFIEVPPFTAEEAPLWCKAKALYECLRDFAIVWTGRVTIQWDYHFSIYVTFFDDCDDLLGKFLIGYVKTYPEYEFELVGQGTTVKITVK